jgi:hypothetical protein
MIEEIQIRRKEILYGSPFVHCLQDTLLFADRVILCRAKPGFPMERFQHLQCRANHETSFGVYMLKVAETSDERDCGNIESGILRFRRNIRYVKNESGGSASAEERTGMFNFIVVLSKRL